MCERYPIDVVKAQPLEASQSNQQRLTNQKAEFIKNNLLRERHYVDMNERERDTLYFYLYKFHIVCMYIHTFIIVFDSYTHNAGYKRGDAREAESDMINQSE